MVLVVLMRFVVLVCHKSNFGNMTNPLFFVHLCHRSAAVEAAIGELLLVGGFEDLETAHQRLVH